MEKMGCFFFLGVEKQTNTKHEARVVCLGIWVLQSYLKLEFGVKGNTGLKWDRHLLGRALQLSKFLDNHTYSLRYILNIPLCLRPLVPPELLRASPCIIITPSWFMKPRTALLSPTDTVTKMHAT